MKTIKVKTSSNIKLPEYKTSGSSGMDLCSIINCSLNPGEVKLIPTGLYVEIPQNYELQIRPRSGLALKNQITVLNTPGTVDESYRGEIGVILVNFGKEPFNIYTGDRIAQCILCPIEKFEWEKVEQLSDTDRGIGGFGSTGIK